MWRSRHLGFGFLILDWHRRNKSNFMIMGSSEHVQAIVLIFCRLSSLGIFPLLRMFSERNKCFLWALFAVCYCLARCFHLDPQNLGMRMGDAYWTRVTIFLACSQKKTGELLSEYNVTFFERSPSWHVPKDTIWHSFDIHSDVLSVYLAYILSSCLAFYLTFCLASFLAFCLQIFWNLIWHYILNFLLHLIWYTVRYFI